MPERTRTFIAIAVPEPVEQKLTQLQAELAPEIAGFRWNSTRPFHITLAFLGDVPDGDLNKICQAVAASTVSFHPLKIEVRGLGAFPNATRPRIVWAGTTATNINALIDLRQSIVGQLKRIGHDPDEERFHPHVTIGRIKHDRRDSRGLHTLIEARAGWSAGEFEVAEVLVMASTLGRAGPVYEVLGRGDLGGKKP
ncbi:MAG TPA: RNA 2',3'-cyclic phosphodiesterase [Isosphaeraceae bacterium]|nr:RNA 2',3'-cyclic phosphodiesterase [Isosphaeraceae bacterium]